MEKPFEGIYKPNLIRRDKLLKQDFELLHEFESFLISLRFAILKKNPSTSIESIH